MINNIQASRQQYAQTFQAKLNNQPEQAPIAEPPKDSFAKSEISRNSVSMKGGMQFLKSLFKPKNELDTLTGLLDKAEKCADKPVKQLKAYVQSLPGLEKVFGEKSPVVSQMYKNIDNLSEELGKTGSSQTKKLHQAELKHLQERLDQKNMDGKTTKEILGRMEELYIKLDQPEKAQEIADVKKMVFVKPN